MADTRRNWKERYGSSGYGVHKDRRTKRARSRQAQKRQALKEQE